MSSNGFMRNMVVAGMIALFSLSVLAQKPATPPENPYTISVNVEVVLFNVTALDKKGRIVSGLRETAFRIVEDGKPQQLTFFRTETSPATVGLIIDNSGSMVNKRPDVIKAAAQFIDESNPDDEVFIVNFNDKVSMGLPPPANFSSNRLDLRNALLRTGADGRTALYDGITEGLNHLKTGTHLKKALVVLSDGGDNASKQGLKEVLKMAEQSTATIFAIGIYDLYDKDRNPKVLRQLAKVTGGEAYIPRNLGQLEDIWGRIAGGIRSQYTIGYVSSNPSRDGKFRSVTISAIGNDGKPLEVRTRPGYMSAK